MNKGGATGRRKGPLSILLARPRLLISIVVGVIVGVLLPYFSDLRGVTRLLVSWDIGVALYLVLAFWMIAHSGPDHIRRRSDLEDEGGIAILVGTIVAAMASVAAVITWLEAETRAETFAPASLVFLFVTVLLSWAFIQTMFALHYADEFYKARGKKKGGGLIFPHDPEPTYWDFVYFAFCHRHVSRGVRCAGHVEENPPDNWGTRHHLLLFQCHADCAHRRSRRRRGSELMGHSAAVRLRPTWPKRRSI